MPHSIDRSRRQDPCPQRSRNGSSSDPQHDARPSPVHNSPSSTCSPPSLISVHSPEAEALLITANTHGGLLTLRETARFLSLESGTRVSYKAVWNQFFQREEKPPVELARVNRGRRLMGHPMPTYMIHVRDLPALATHMGIQLSSVGRASRPGSANVVPAVPEDRT